MPAPLIDITRLLYRRMTGQLPTGIDRVGLEYVRHFAGRGRAVLSYRGRAAVLPERASARAFEALLNASREPLLGAWLASRAALWDWRSRNAAGSVLLNTGHYGLENRRYAGPLRRRGARVVVFVHDLIPFTHPEYCRAGERERHAARMRTALGIASGIIVNSQDTLDTLRRYAAQAALACPPALVAPLASSLPATAEGPRPIAEPYFVILGTIEPRKNHWLLLNAWRRLVERLGAAAPRLLVIGRRGWECENVVDMLERCEELRGYVIERSACADAELVTALSHARALLVPSFAEGYGIPAVEALSLGVPVIAADLAVFREFAGAVPDYVDPLDARGWMEAIADYAPDASARRAAQKARLAAFRPPAWREHLRAVEAFIERLPR